jgi:hypothetical protein
VLPGRLTLIGAYLQGKGGTLNGSGRDYSTNAFTAGANYNLTQNIFFQLASSWYSGSAFDQRPANGDNMTTAMLFSAF